MARALVMLSLALAMSGCVHYLGDAEPHVGGDVATSLTIPMRIESQTVAGVTGGAARLLVPCTIQGRSGWCQFDTGARGLTVYRCFQADGDSYGAGEYAGVSGQSRVQKGRRLAAMTIGPYRYEDLLVDYDRGHVCDRELALIGLDLFKTRLVIDPRSLILADHGAKVTPTLPLESRGGALFVPVQLGGRTLLALFDTGSWTTVVDETRVDLPGKAVNRKRYEAVDSTHTVVAVNKLVRTSLTVGGLELADVVVGTMDLRPLAETLHRPVAMVLGMNAIARLVWSFDQETGTWGVAVP